MGSLWRRSTCGGRARRVLLRPARRRRPGDQPRHRAAALCGLAGSNGSLHATLTVADLHADSLLWGRDLNQRASSGHVDIPG